MYAGKGVYIARVSDVYETHANLDVLKSSPVKNTLLATTRCYVGASCTGVPYGSISTLVVWDPGTRAVGDESLRCGLDAAPAGAQSV